MIDLTNCKEVINTFGGSEVKKRIMYEGRYYMVKFPDPIREKNNELSYMNNQFSEDIGCKIFKNLGMETQNTFLAKYKVFDKEKVVVACEDFTQDGNNLIEFHKLSLMFVESSSIRTQSNLDNVLQIIDNTSGIKDKIAFKKDFWKMFLIDGFIGNSDRNLDNWGVLENKGDLKFAPIYDCGSSLAPLLTEERMTNALKNPNIFKRDEFNVYSCYRINRNRILFSEYIKNPSKEFSEIIMEVVPRINMKEIKKIIDSTPAMTDIHKTYINEALKLRYEQILIPALKRELKRNKDISENIIANSIKKQEFTEAYEDFKRVHTFKGNVAIQFMKDVVKAHGTNGDILQKAVESVALRDNLRSEEMAKLLQATLKTDEYQKAFEKEQGKTQENTR